jgi:alpha-ribazole phosphatase
MILSIAGPSTPMNPYTLTLLRHGKIDHQGSLVGQHECALTDSGQAVMERSWKQIVALAPVSTMATSPLQRCREFAVRHALATSVPLKVDQRFSDCDFGSWQGMSQDKLSQQHPGWEKTWQSGALDIPQAETAAVFQTRVLTGFSEWIASTHGSHRLLVTHARVITSLLGELLDMSPSAARLITVQPGGFVQLSILEDHPAYLMHLEAPLLS